MDLGIPNLFFKSVFENRISRSVNQNVSLFLNIQVRIAAKMLLYKFWWKALYLLVYAKIVPHIQNT